MRCSGVADRWSAHTAIGVSFGPQHPTGRAACVGCTRVHEQHRLIGVKVVQQFFIRLDEPDFCFSGSSLRDTVFWFAMFHAMAVQQRNQAGPAWYDASILPSIQAPTSRTSSAAAASRRSSSSACPAALGSGGRHSRPHSSRLRPAPRCHLPHTARYQVRIVSSSSSRTFAMASPTHAVVQ